MNLRQRRFVLLRAENITNLMRILSVFLVANYKVENARDWLLCYDLSGILIQSLSKYVVNELLMLAEYQETNFVLCNFSNNSNILYLDKRLN